MKKFKYTLQILMTFALLGQVSAQEVQDPNFIYKSLEKRFSKSEADIQNPKKNVKAATWLKRGDMMIEIYNVDQQFMGIGLSKEQVNLFYKEPEQETTEEHKGKSMLTYVYPRMKVYFDEQGAAADWVVTQYVTENPLQKAVDAYKKGFELEPETAEKYVDKIDDLKKNCEKEAAMTFKRGEYGKSMESFELTVMASQLKPEAVRTVDTSNIFNAGLAASNAKRYEKSIEFFNKALSYNYEGGNIYILLKDAYINLGDSAKILPLLKDGFQRNPENQEIILELTNYYLNSGQAKEALDYLRIAKEKDPTNASFYFVEGTLLDKMGETDKAIEAYKTAIEMDPSRFIPYYNMGVIHYNKAVNHIEEANKQPNTKAGQKAYDEFIKKAEEQLKNAVPYMSKALEIAEKDFMENPSNEDAIANYKGTLDTLKTIYFRLRNSGDEYQVALDDVNMKLNSLK